MAASDTTFNDGAVSAPQITELQRRELPHLNAAYGRASISSNTESLLAATPGGSLPYDLLGPHTFERLCFHLLLARGEAPRFWGRRGQAQHGIDLILSNGRANVVYQCKHHTTFSAAALEQAVRKFEQDWLSRPELGRPETFVLCTSAALQETEVWETTKRNLSDELGIAIEEWHRAALDTWLRSEPGIVADLFGDRVAELFCGLAARWDLELFRPIERGFDRRRVDRYLDLVEANQLVRDPRDEAAFNEILSRSSIVLLEGRAGAGKTTAALDLAVAHTASAGRVFYLRADEIESLDRVITGFKGRTFRPSIFVIDDAHKAFDKIEGLVNRVASLHGLKLVLTARTPPPGMDMLDPAGTDFVADLRDTERTIEIEADMPRVGLVVAKKRPDWSNPPIHRLIDLAGRDLAILNMVLEAVEPAEFDKTVTLEALLARILQLVFRGQSAHAPRLKRLAAIAQFDVMVPREAFPEPLEAPRNSEAVERFVVAGGAPSALAFRHSSEAELVYRLLAYAHGETNVEAACAKDCAQVLLDCIERRGRADVLNDLLPQFLRTRLNFSDDGIVKRVLLADPRITELVIAADTSLFTLSLAAFLCGRSVPAYPAQLAERLEAQASDPSASAGIGMLGLHLRTLQIADASAHHDLQRRIGAEQMAQLVALRGDFSALLRILQHSSEWFALALIEAISDDDLQLLVERTIEQGASIATLHLPLRDLSQRTLPGDEGRTQADLLFARLGAERIAQLVAARGHLAALLTILQYSPEWFAAALLGALSDDDVKQLFERTLKHEVSIRTLALQLRALGQRTLPGDKGRTQADLLFARLDAERIAQLVAVRGDLGVLLKIVQYSPDKIATELIKSFTTDDLGLLAERIVEREGSIGTLNLSLHQMGQRTVFDSEDQTLRDLFEEGLGVDFVWRLVLSAGNLNHLAYLLDGLSPAFRARLLEPDEAPNLEGWIALAMRGTFYDPARFAKDILGRLPTATAERMRLAVEATASKLAAASSWGELGSGFAALEEVEDVRIRTALLDAANARINSIALDDLSFDGYDDAVAGIIFLWRNRPAMRSKLGAALWRLLPNEDHWPSNYRLLLQSRFLLMIARAPEVAQADALRMLRANSSLGPEVALDPRSARYHALFLWNLFALWFERGRSQVESFSKLQTSATWQRFVEVVAKRQSWRRNQDKLDTLMLAGTLALLVPDLRPQLVRLVRGKIKGISFLADMADQKLTFIPAALVCHGLALSASPRGIFTSGRVAQLIKKAEDYEERGPALDYLCNSLVT